MSDDLYGFAVKYQNGFVSDAYSSRPLGTFEWGRFHEYELRTRDGRTYQFLIDGRPSAQENAFPYGSDPPRFTWGDSASGRSLSEWDWVGYGTVADTHLARQIPGDNRGRVVMPEPTAAMLLMEGACLLGLLRRTRYLLRV